MKKDIPAECPFNTETNTDAATGDIVEEAWPRSVMINGKRKRLDTDDTEDTDELPKRPRDRQASLTQAELDDMEQAQGEDDEDDE